MMPRVLFVNHGAQIGGGELSLLDAVQPFRETSTVVAFEHGPLLERLSAQGMSWVVEGATEALLRVTRTGTVLSDVMAVPGMLSLVRRVARWAREHDVIYANSQKAMLVSACAGRLANRPVLWHLRDLMTPQHFSATQLRLARTVARRGVAHVIANSEATKKAWVLLAGHPGRVSVIYNGVAATPFDADPEGAVRSLRASVGLDARPALGIFSRLASWKGQHVLLDALDELPDVQALIVGDALFEADQAYAAQVRRRSRAPGLKGRVHLLGFREDVPALTRAVDIVVHASTEPEPFGRVVVEGMLAGRPVVAADAGGVREIIDSGRTGLLVPPGDPQAMADAVQHLLRAPELAAALAQAARIEALARFAVPRMQGDIVRLVRMVASAPGCSASARLISSTA